MADYALFSKEDGQRIAKAVKDSENPPRESTGIYGPADQSGEGLLTAKIVGSVDDMPGYYWARIWLVAADPDATGGLVEAHLSTRSDADTGVTNAIVRNLDELGGNTHWISNGVFVQGKRTGQKSDGKIYIDIQGWKPKLTAEAGKEYVLAINTSGKMEWQEGGDCTPPSSS